MENPNLVGALIVKGLVMVAGVGMIWFMFWVFMQTAQP